MARAKKIVEEPQVMTMSMEEGNEAGADTPTTLPIFPDEMPSMPEPLPYRVYARVDEAKVVQRFLTTCFDEILETDIFIKEGFGDEFVHIGYLQVYDLQFLHNYKVELVEGSTTEYLLVERTKEEKDAELIEIVNKSRTPLINGWKYTEDGKITNPVDTHLSPYLLEDKVGTLVVLVDSETTKCYLGVVNELGLINLAEEIPANKVLSVKM